jgi:predicted DNA-binding protein YlxM (UPF0122 family)
MKFKILRRHFINYNVFKETKKIYDMPNIVLTPEQVKQIRVHIQENKLSNAEIGDLFSIGAGSIKSIRYKKTWAWLI